MRKFSQIMDSIFKQKFPRFWNSAPLDTWGDFPDFIHFLLIADGMEEQYSSIPPFNASATTPADVYKLNDNILSNFKLCTNCLL